MQIRLFVISCILGGIGGFLGSVIGSFFGATALFAGGFLGGVLVAPLSAKLALWRRWIAPSQYRPTVLGAALGFIAAAVIAVNTLSSPIGPALSPVLVGLGALVGSRWPLHRSSARQRSTSESDPR